MAAKVSMWHAIATTDPTGVVSPFASSHSISSLYIQLIFSLSHSSWIQALYNVSTTSSRDPDFVLAELRRALQSKGIPVKQKG